MITVIPKQKVRELSLGQKVFGETFKIDTLGISDRRADGGRKSVQLELSPKHYSLPSKELHANFVTRCAEIILKHAVFEGTNRKSKVCEFRDPEVLSELIDFKLREDAESDDKLFNYVMDIITYSVKTGHPFFVNQLYSGIDPYGLVGQWLTDALNPSVYTYEVSPVFSLMEEVVLKEMRQIVGFPDGVGDGIFCPGGSIANGYAISCARHYVFPGSKKHGNQSIGRLVIFTSRDAHYSIVKLATFMGIGSENVYLVETDARGKMIPEDLEKTIRRAVAEKAKPFMVSATAGTTVLGAFDPLDKIADICEKYGLWFHVDAAWGGGAFMSQKHKHLLAGAHRADSIIWNPHKLLAAPQQCSVFLTRHPKILTDCHSTNATYLFQKDKFYDIKYDTGDKHIQCGRRADVLKFWFMWKAKGTGGFERHIDKIFKNAQYFTNQIKDRVDFRLVLPEPECTNVCFWYIPPSLRTGTYTTEALHQVAPKIKERMMKQGLMMCTYQTLHDLPNFFRLALENSGLQEDDMDRIIEIFQQLGSDL